MMFSGKVKNLFNLEIFAESFHPCAGFEIIINFGEIVLIFFGCEKYFGIGLCALELYFKIMMFSAFIEYFL
jgi:hypothetical protein